MKLGEKILNYRKKLSLSQEELGEKVGVSRQTVSKWEIGQTIPELEKMILLAKEFETTIDELVKDEENAQGNRKFDSENKVKKFVENFKKYNKIINIIIVILIICIICFIGKVVYRINLLNKFEETINKFTSDYRIENEIYDINYRLEISTYKTDRGLSGLLEEEISYYVNNNVFTKWYNDNNGGRYNPDRIELLNYDTDEYYDIDIINKVYTKKMISELDVDTKIDLTNQEDFLINDMLANTEIIGWKNKLKLALDFDIMINKNKPDRYYISYFSDDNTELDLGVSPRRISYSINKVDENNKSCKKAISYGLDLDVVVNKDLITVPDLTGYTKIEN